MNLLNGFRLVVSPAILAHSIKWAILSLSLSCCLPFRHLSYITFRFSYWGNLSNFLFISFHFFVENSQTGRVSWARGNSEHFLFFNFGSPFHYWICQFLIGSIYGKTLALPRPVSLSLFLPLSLFYSLYSHLVVQRSIGSIRTFVAELVYSFREWFVTLKNESTMGSSLASFVIAKS